MSDWKQRLKKWVVPEPVGQSATFATVCEVPAGLYHYQRPRDGEYVRFHLRVEADGTSILLVAASEAVRLSPTGTCIAKQLLDGVPRERVQAEIGGAYADHLVGEVARVLDEIGRPSQRFPVFNMADPLAGGAAARLMAPLQADVVLSDHFAVRELLQRLWDAGIPHVRFLSGDDTGTQCAIEAVVRAEDLGMIAGIRAPAGWWSDDARVRQLSQAGLDYVVLPWLPDPSAHAQVFGPADQGHVGEIVLSVRSWEMTPVLEVPLLTETRSQFEDRLGQLAEWDVAHVEMYALVSDGSAPPASNTPGHFEPLRPAALRQLAAWAEGLADAEPLQVIWLAPREVADDQPLAKQLAAGPRAGGDLAIRVEPNGDILAPRGPATAAGNLFSDPWPTIWNHPVLARYRQRVETVTRCDQCPGLAVCATDCPADPHAWARAGERAEQGSRGAGEQGSRGAGERGSGGAGEQGSAGRHELG